MSFFRWPVTGGSPYTGGFQRGLLYEQGLKPRGRTMQENSELFIANSARNRPELNRAKPFWVAGAGVVSRLLMAPIFKTVVAAENRALKQRCETTGTLGGGVQEWPSEDKNDV